MDEHTEGAPDNPDPVRDDDRTAGQLRELFLEYFRKNGHQAVASAALVPGNDPTLLFTNAGMVQFKDVFTGAETRDYTRATSSQKCLRVSGKHNDLEQVGRTKRHHTFFEMLGNFSFGDYFKEEAIAFAWELLTKDVGLPKQRLWATVFREDDEAEALWKKIADLPAERIIRMDEKDNFWAMGDTGPCGPCSEIHFDLGQGPGTPADDDGDRFLEVWNLVFMQFDRDSSGEMTPLPKPSIDTGMGLERLAAVVQGAGANWDTDLFRPLLELSAELSGKPYRPGRMDTEDDVSMRVIADHARATAFLVADGIVPGNIGRNYVLRRLMRRAIRHGERLGLHDLFFHQVCDRVVDLMGDHFTELGESREHLEKIAQQEEEQFRRTLKAGLRVLEREMNDLVDGGAKVVPGSVVFFLHDTHGFPPDLTATIAEERGLDVDHKEYKKLRDAAAGSDKGDGEDPLRESLRKVLDEQGATTNLYFQGTEAAGTVTALLDTSGNILSQAEAGAEVQVLTDQTPFYGEAGGQVGDTGTIVGPNGTIDVTDTWRPLNGLTAHVGKVRAGTVATGESVTLTVDAPRRRDIRHHHSATHLLHWALRDVLGKHVRQAGSRVAPDSLRFDFNHYQKVSPDELRVIEAKVNHQVIANAAVQAEEMSMAEATERGAIAFFGDKYGDRVRVIQIGPDSVELCGGTHVDRSGDIGLFKLVGEGSSSAGVRRVEAVTGGYAVDAAQNVERELASAAQLLGVPTTGVAERVEKLLEDVKALTRERDNLRAKKAASGIGDLLAEAREVNGARVVAGRVEVGSPKELRALSDGVLEKLGEGALLLVGVAGERVSLVCRVHKERTGEFHAGNIIREVAPLVGGKGGGKPDMAQGGGSDSSHVDDVIKRFYEIVGAAG